MGKASILEVLNRDYKAAGTERQSAPRSINLGLSTVEAQQLLSQHGENVLAHKKRTSRILMFAGQFKDVLVMILLASTVVSVLLGEVYDALTIIVIVIMNAILGFVQEFRTERTLEALRDMAAPSAKVYRDGKLTTIPAAELVVGDVLEVEAGDKVAADAAILRCMALYADEAILTGEAVPAAKRAAQGQSVTNELNRPEVLYMGTAITKGHGVARVIATGMRTQMGLVSGMIADIVEEQTPLQKRLSELGKILAVTCVGICAVVALIGIARGEDVFEMLLTGISLAVAAIPEGLPASVTISLALAVRRMLAQNALVHKLHSVETLGCASVICSDKTGTLTENKMTVNSLYIDGGEMSVTGDGYKIAGAFEQSGAGVSPHQNKQLHMLLECGALCNNAQIYAKTPLTARNRGMNTNGGQWSVAGDPTEIALLVAAAKGHMTAQSLRSEYERTDEVPFDSISRSMTVVVRDRTGKHRAYLKGAIDVVLDKCGLVLTESGTELLTYAKRREILAANDRMTERALRVLCFAVKELGAEKAAGADAGYTFVGLQGMADPPRSQVHKAVKTCARASVKTVMITGDHKNTACAVAKQVGILRADSLVLTGQELGELSDEKLAGCIDRVAVFARVSPADKLRIVRAFKAKGHIVAMTGDGVNDAAAVKEASIGVSMGISGTDVTREAADITLLDDNFATLVNAVRQGRTIYANIRKFVRYLLSCNIGEVVTMVLGMLFGFPVVLIPIQILLVNLVTDGLPAIALGLEPPEDSIMNKPPRKATEGIFSGGLLYKIVLRGILIGISTMGTFAAVLTASDSLMTARTAALFTLAMTQLFHVFECKSETKTLFSVPYFNNWKLIFAAALSCAVLLAAIWLPPLQAIFSTVPLDLSQVGTAMGFALLAPIISALLNGRGKNA